MFWLMSLVFAGLTVFMRFYPRTLKGQKGPWIIEPDS